MNKHLGALAHAIKIGLSPMKVSLLALKRWLPQLALEPNILAQRLTMAGLEVDAVFPAAGPLEKVVVGCITAITNHPQSKRLLICQVDIGSTAHVQIVCGAPNVNMGLKVACAQVGATLANDVHISKVNLAGVASAGMLCSAQELGMSAHHEGILELAENAPVGVALKDYLQLDDWIFELNLTPNRADCLSIYGVARELAALLDCHIEPMAVVPCQPDFSHAPSVECPHYKC